MSSEAHALRVSAFEAVHHRCELSFALLGDPHEYSGEQQGIAITAAQSECAIERRRRRGGLAEPSRATDSDDDASDHDRDRRRESRKSRVAEAGHGRADCSHARDAPARGAGTRPR